MVTLHLDDDVIRSLSGNELNILKYVYTHAEDKKQKKEIAILFSQGYNFFHDFPLVLHGIP